jgi:hypothetical protein
MTETTIPLDAGDYLRAIQKENNRLPDDEALSFHDLMSYKHRIEKLLAHYYIELLGGYNGS